MLGKTINDVAVIIGDKNVTARLQKMEWSFVTRIDIFPDYNMLHSYKDVPDVAILTLETPVSPFITPICLPSLSASMETFSGKSATVGGWGKTEKEANSIDHLMSVDVSIISNSKCKESYSWIKKYLKTTQHLYRKYYIFIFRFHLCTLEGSGHCDGDSGGPLFILDILSTQTKKRLSSPTIVPISIPLSSPTSYTCSIST